MFASFKADTAAKNKGNQQTKTELQILDGRKHSQIQSCHRHFNVPPLLSLETFQTHESGKGLLTDTDFMPDELLPINLSYHFMQRANRQKQQNSRQSYINIYRKDILGTRKVICQPKGMLAECFLRVYEFICLFKRYGRRL
jgi:hypothetical protein